MGTWAGGCLTSGAERKQGSVPIRPRMQSPPPLINCHSPKSWRRSSSTTATHDMQERPISGPPAGKSCTGLLSRSAPGRPMARVRWRVIVTCKLTGRLDWYGVQQETDMSAGRCLRLLCSSAAFDSLQVHRCCVVGGRVQAGHPSQRTSAPGAPAAAAAAGAAAQRCAGYGRPGRLRGAAR